MAIDPLDTPQPVKVALLPLAAARQAVRLASEQNQQLREARLKADEQAQENRAAAQADARAAAEQRVRDTNAPTGVDTASRPSTESGGGRVDISA